MRRLAVICALTLTLAACGAPAETDSPVVELHTYVVPHGFENDVRVMLRHALDTGDESRIGRADLGPGGTLVVVAPAGIHRGVRDFISHLESMDVPPTTPQPISLTYTMIVGRPVDSAGAEGFRVSGADRLEAIREALGQIAAAQGPTEFRLLERIQLVSTGDDHAETNGQVAAVRQRATMLQEHVIADVDVRMRPYAINSQIRLRPDQLVVLGNTGYGGLPGHDDAGQSESLYYVISAQVAL